VTPILPCLQLGASNVSRPEIQRADEGRAAHLAGPMAAALMANAAKLLAKPPQIGHVDVLGVKLPN
jgi:hypothetical protein